MNNPASVYSPERARKIRMALAGAVAYGVLTGILAAVFGVIADTSRETVGAVVLGVIAAVTILWSLLALRLLATPDSAAKRAVVVSGVLLILFALPTFPLGLLSAVLGLLLIFLAVSDEGAGT